MNNRSESVKRKWERIERREGEGDIKRWETERERETDTKRVSKGRTVG